MRYQTVVTMQSNIQWNSCIARSFNSYLMKQVAKKINVLRIFNHSATKIVPQYSYRPSPPIPHHQIARFLTSHQPHLSDIHQYPCVLASPTYANFCVNLSYTITESQFYIRRLSPLCFRNKRYVLAQYLSPFTPDLPFFVIL